MSKLEYSYYSPKNKTFVALGFSSPRDYRISYVQFPFSPDASHTFYSETDLVLYCADNNRRVEGWYEETSKIKPPYLLRPFINYVGDALFGIKYRDRGLTFEDMRVMPELARDVWDTVDDAPVYEFFKRHRDQLFDPAMMVKFHKFAMEKEVFSPLPRYCGRIRFSVKMGDHVVNAELCKSLSRRPRPYFLQFANCGDGLETNAQVFRYYDIPKENLLHILGVRQTQGDWPYSEESKVYEIINYINRIRYANTSQLQEITIRDNVVMCSFGTFTIEQTINSTWYLRGDLDNILRMFKLNSKDELKAYMNGVLGEKRRSGVFPECETKEEIIKLIETITR